MLSPSLSCIPASESPGTRAAPCEIQPTEDKSQYLSIPKPESQLQAPNTTLGARRVAPDVTPAGVRAAVFMKENAWRRGPAAQPWFSLVVSQELSGELVTSPLRLVPSSHLDPFPPWGAAPDTLLWLNWVPRNHKSSPDPVPPKVMVFEHARGQGSGTPHLPAASGSGRCTIQGAWWLC